MGKIQLERDVTADIVSGEPISDDTAVTIASWWHGGNDHNITALSHGIEWHAGRLIDEIDDNQRRHLASGRWGTMPDASLTALRAWVIDHQVITSVWSAYGHQFTSSDEYESCLSCGAEFELVHDDAEYTSHGRYRASNGDDPTECAGTSIVHGDPREQDHGLHCDDGCDECQHECNCMLCR